MKKLLLLALCALFVGRAAAAPVSQADAKHAAAAWLATAPILGYGDVQSIRPANVISYEDDDGTVLFHVVVLEKGGFVVTAADDAISPILSYSTSGEPPDEDPRNPFWDLAAMGVRNRMAAVEMAGEWTDDPKADTFGESLPVSPRDEWAALLGVDLGKLDEAVNPVSDVSDKRIDRLLLDRGAAVNIYWLTQKTADAANANWNYTTTYKYANISQQYGEEFASKNYADWAWGCGVVAVAKVMMYWGHPGSRPSGFSYQPPKNLTGYNWLHIASGTDRISDVALLSDVGEAMCATYSVKNGQKSGSTSSSSAKSALTDEFGYANAEFLNQSSGIDSSTFRRILGSNLDAKCPVILHLSDHAVVADGYGYIGNDLYFHLDLGWGGDSYDYWWNLPFLPVSSIGYGEKEDNYDAILALTYNIFPLDKNVQIISGRTTDSNGKECLAMVSISGPNTSASCMPDGHGIFYFIVPKGSGTYTVAAQYLLETKTRTVQLDGKNLNYWGCDFEFGAFNVPGGIDPGNVYPGGIGSTYKVKFLPNGGKGKMSAQKMAYGKAARLKANKFKRKGHVFLGWAKTKKGAVVYKNKQTVANLAANGGTVKLYAKWGKKAVVKFDPNGGTVKKKSKIATTGKSLGKLPTPTRKNRGFQGWWTKRSGGKRVTSSTKATRSMTVYARWGEVCLPNGGPYKQKANGILWWFRVSKGKAILTGSSGKLPRRVRIPSKLGGRPVVGIDGCAFSGRSRMKSVTIPNSVMSIGEGAFRNCSGLKSVKLPSKLKSIGAEAFYNCSHLTSISIPNGVTSIGRGAFAYCSRLKSAKLSKNVKSIEPYTFAGCRRLASVTIPDGVSSIGEFAFSSCGFRSIAIPSSVTSIGDYAFSGCSGLTSVVIPDSVASMGNWVFEDCSGLMSASIPTHLRGCTWSWWNIPSSCRIIVR